MCYKGKNIWKGPRPEGWPENIPFQDPNRTSKDETNRTFILNKITMLESYTFGGDFEHYQFTFKRDRTSKFIILLISIMHDNLT